jgi:hypothetical protein
MDNIEHLTILILVVFHFVTQILGLRYTKHLEDLLKKFLNGNSDKFHID